jgi:hypothetical protein
MIGAAFAITQYCDEYELERNYIAKYMEGMKLTLDDLVPSVEMAKKTIEDSILAVGTKITCESKGRVVESFGAGDQGAPKILRRK